MSIRLSISNSITARRTRELYTPVQHVSMSGSEKKSNIQASAARKAYEQRIEYFSKNGGK